MSRIFRRYVYTWWQIALLKIALLALGILLGAWLADAALGAFWWLVAAWIAPASYLLWHSLRPHSPTNPKNIKE